MNSLDFDTDGARKRYWNGLVALVISMVIVPTICYFTAHAARQTIVKQRIAEKQLNAPRMRFLEGSPQFNRPFKLALERNFAPQRSYFSSSPALSYLDKKGVSSQKLAEQYETLWRLLEYLQLQRDFSFEEKALRMFLTASSTEVITAMGENPNGYLQSDDFPQYQFLSEQGLAWYLQHYYIDPATALTQTHQYGGARHLIYEALRRLQFRPVSLARYLRVPEYDRVMLLAAIFSAPEIFIGHDDTLQLLLKIVLDDFPKDGKFEIESHSFSVDLVPLQKHMLGIYELRDYNYESAIKYFNDSIVDTSQNYRRDLAIFMVVRARFWSMHDNLVRRKVVLTIQEANKFSLMLDQTSHSIQAPNLKTNIREYISLVKTDFTTRSGLNSKIIDKEKSQVKQPIEKLPVKSTVVPAISSLPPLPLEMRR